MATLRAYFEYTPAVPEGMPERDFTGYATVTYSVATTNTDVTVTVTKVEIGDSTLKGGSVSVTLGGTSIGSWSNISGSTTKTLDKSKTQSRGHTSSSMSLSVNVRGTIGSGGSYGTATDSASNSTSIPVSARPSYAVSYNANGGGYAPSAQTKWHDETLKLSSSKPSRSGYVFWHWNTSSANSGTTYAPEANYTANAALSLYAIWNPIIAYNGNGGSNVPASQTKTFGTNLTLSTTIPTRVGYKFLSWNTKADGTGTTYQPGGTYTSNAATTLYAMWQRVAQAPTISSIKVVRCTSTGTESDAGTYCKLTAQWSVDTASDAGMGDNQGAVTGTISANGESRTIAFSSGTSGTSGTATAIVPDCDTDTQYLVTVTVTNTVIGAGNTELLSTSRSDILTMAFFTMDFAAGGRGIGIGTAAPADGIELGLPVQFDDDVNVLGNLVAPNLTLASETGTDVASASSGSNWGITDGSTYGYRYGPFSMVSICATSTTALVAGTQYTVATITSKFKPIRDVGFANQYGHGLISSGGSVNFRPTVAVGANTTMRMGAMYIAGS